jgi:hypothetical protein
MALPQQLGALKQHVHQLQQQVELRAQISVGGGLA